MSDPEPGAQPAEPPQPHPGYDYQQQGYGYSYGPQVWNYSGFWRRAGAFVLDIVITGVLSSLVVSVLGDDGSLWFVNLIVNTTYFSILEGTRGQTIGGMAANIRVVDADNGTIIGIGRAIVRNLVRIVSGFVLWLGYFWMLWDPRKQTWHDKVANSVVIRTA
jgi:uncharacterized RDD family membrane protein YckC